MPTNSARRNIQLVDAHMLYWGVWCLLVSAGVLHPQMQEEQQQ